MDTRWRAHSITLYSGCLLRMNACLLPTVDSDADKRHFTHYSGYRMSRQEFTHYSSWVAYLNGALLTTVVMSLIRTR
ncbi:hypothetical protein B7D55_21955 [Salmonella enterica subsp. enterica serovar Schwarzengrund]|uniref:Uncharacterized protein n=1 Tax=Salmonella typhimurium TaxID=90371 RepID=A0A709XY37_SALTM|nr:hypothetical protein [Salmonella enterica subsp. enterica]EAQ9186643.1 hypothetical protein [Salmonella enterica]EBM0687578.1 hypothetical protein [Salmonella enterica subsp. enterica serovar Schwarzengrund]EBV9622528.1 hypothetical protein [Salmonella enterica subsp. enterica serovar Typhimurium var. 5-]ECH0986786.1 hypothetical protein [Salmonella enterica subsp. enterica serovar Enteritidis]ECM4258791.1 hypothetical protein [Salmonella enterica subsp. enterica serovar Heidelberg]ECM7461